MLMLLISLSCLLIGLEDAVVSSLVCLSAFESIVPDKDHVYRKKIDELEREK